MICCFATVRDGIHIFSRRDGAVNTILPAGRDVHLFFAMVRNGYCIDYVRTGRHIFFHGGTGR